MNSFRHVYWNRTSDHSFFNRRYILTILVLLSASIAASASASLSKVSCGSNAYSEPANDACSVYLTAAANRKLNVSLTSDNPAVTVPGTLTVRAGALTTGFNAVVSGVTTPQTATITAQEGGAVATFTISLSPATTPALTLSATSLPFGNVTVGTAVSNPITLTSSGTGALTINAVPISGSGFTVSGGSLPVTLNPGQATVLSVQFSPTSAGSVTGQLAISSNAPLAAVSLSGTGTAAPLPTMSAVSCSSTSITGSLADPCTVSLSGPAPTGGMSVSLASNNAAVTLPASVTLPAGSSTGSFTVSVASVSTSQAATVTASTNNSSQSLALQLNATTPALTLGATTVSFGSVNIGTQATKSVTLTSSGTAPVTISSVSLAGSLFGATGITPPITLNPGQTANMTVTFSPLVANPWSYTGVVTINSNAPTATINMSGAGAAPAPTMSAVSCSGTSITGSLADACTVTLSGAAPTGGTSVTLASSSSAVTVPASVTVAAGATSAGFTASVTAVGTAQTATVTASANNSSQSLALQLNAATPSLTLSATSVSFGSVNVGTQATSSVILTSSGTAPVTISSVSVAGSLFGATGITPPITLNPGQTANMTVTFSPLVANPWSYTGVVTITSNASTATINMSGTGAAVAPTVSTLSCSSTSITGSLSDACTVTLSGAAPTGGTSVSLASSSSAVTVPASVTVAAGATTAAFTANVASVSTAQTATLTAATASTSVTLSLQVNGAGETHQVDLSWSSPAGSSDPVVGYNIYRAPSGTTSYQRVNATVETQTAYTDTAVQEGTAYSYYVTSVDAQGVESVPSNTTTVTVP